MYLGYLVELGEAQAVCERPRHPYTISLMSAVPVADPDAPPADRPLEGDVPSPVNPPLRLPVSPPLPAGHRRVPPLDAGAHHHRRRAHLRLPQPADGLSCCIVRWSPLRRHGTVVPHLADGNGTQ